VEMAEPDEADLRYDLNVRAAERHEKDLESPRDAITALNAALEARPGDPAVLKSLERLYRSEQMWDDLLENLKQQAAAAEEKEPRVALRIAIGDLYAAQLQSPSDAIEHYRLVLDEDLTNDHAIQAVRAIGEAREELRLDAAGVLEPVLRGAGRHEELAAALELRLRAQTDPSDRATTLRTIARVQDEQLGRPVQGAQALGALGRRRGHPRATMRSMGIRARAATAAGTFTSPLMSRRQSRSLGSVIIFM